MMLAKQPKSLTRSSLLPEARHLVLPKGIRTTGFPSVEATCRQLGLEFDPWQRTLNRCILGKGKRRQYAADTVVMSIPRQVGKTWDIGALAFALCVQSPGLTVIWTAHRFKVARETFESLRSLARSPKLAPHIDQAPIGGGIASGAGNESITFRNGSRIVFAARERGAVRGFTKVDIIILDEAQILTDGALSDMAPTQNQADNPLIILLSSEVSCCWGYYRHVVLNASAVIIGKHCNVVGKTWQVLIARRYDRAKQSVAKRRHVVVNERSTAVGNADEGIASYVHRHHDINANLVLVSDSRHYLGSDAIDATLDVGRQINVSKGQSLVNLDLIAAVQSHVSGGERQLSQHQIHHDTRHHEAQHVSHNSLIGSCRPVL
jgi:hypothetical protein